MKQRIFILAIILAVVLLSLFTLSKKERNTAGQPVSKTTKETSHEVKEADPSTAPNTQTHSTRSGAAKIIEAVYSASIDFYGKVVDQHGKPVSGAKVQCSVVDQIWSDGSKRESMSDNLGFFSLKNVRGAGVLVGVGKEGYDQIDGLSGANFAIGMPPDSTRRASPTKQNPAVFVLRKMAKPEVMTLTERSVRLPKNGTPVEISVSTGKPVTTGKGDLVFECWTLDEKKDERRRYEWRCRISVPGGGLIERGQQLSNEAPADGYAQSIEVNMNPTSPEWEDSHDQQYFLKLQNGNYARARLVIIAGGDHYARFQIYLNPSGSRNLEYDQKLDPSQRAER